MLPSGIKLIYFCRIIKQNMTVMDLYADDLTDYIYQENDVDKNGLYYWKWKRESRNSWVNRKG